MVAENAGTKKDKRIVLQNICKGENFWNFIFNVKKKMLIYCYLGTNCKLLAAMR